MAHTCKDCLFLEMQGCGCSDYCSCGIIGVECGKRSGVSNLKQFPFKKTQCAEYKTKSPRPN